MAKATGFLEFSREEPKRRPIALRLADWREIYVDQSHDDTASQAARCMDCGIPFCHYACPLGNRIPEWNTLVYGERGKEALERLHATNNFPEFTGRLCPAPCESACVLAISDAAVTIEHIEYEIAEQGFREGWVVPEAPVEVRDQHVAIVGSGPAGLAAAQQLRRAGYAVSVFERADAVGGLLRYGIPEFKMEKAILDRRLHQLVAEGVQFHTSVDVGAHGHPSLVDLRNEFDAVVLAIGSTRPRTIPVPGSQLAGVYAAMTYLRPANHAALGQPTDLSATAAGRDVIILGGGDTGADCLGTALRQGAQSVTQLELLPRPPARRPADQPWPTMPVIFRTAGAHEEGGERLYHVDTMEFLGDDAGRVRALRVREHRDDAPTDASVREIPTSLVLIAAGFVGPEITNFADAVTTTPQGTVAVTSAWQCVAESDDLAAIFACGDCVRGQSLIVWAIAEGRSAAAAVDAHLRGAPSPLGSPVTPYFKPWE